MDSIVLTTVAALNAPCRWCRPTDRVGSDSKTV